MVLAIDFRLVPMLMQLLGRGMITSGSMVSAFSSSVKYSLDGRSWLAGEGTPSRAKVELEPVYKASAWPAMVVLERGEELCQVKVSRMRGYGVAYIA